MDIRESINKEFKELRRVRDELKVQAHLAKADAKDAWDRLEGRWPEVEQKMKLLERQAEHAAQDVAGATQELLKEFREGYRKITHPHE